MTPKHIQEIKERLEKATPGPLKFTIGNGNSVSHIWTHDEASPNGIVATTYSFGAGEMMGGNADLFSNARADIEKLLRTVEIQAKALEDAKAYIKVLNDTLFAMSVKTNDKSTKILLGSEIEHSTRAHNQIKQAQKEAEEVWS